jgi:hypothetical protein
MNIKFMNLFFLLPLCLVCSKHQNPFYVRYFFKFLQPLKFSVYFVTDTLSKIVKFFFRNVCTPSLCQSQSAVCPSAEITRQTPNRFPGTMDGYRKHGNKLSAYLVDRNSCVRDTVGISRGSHCKFLIVKLT